MPLAEVRYVAHLQRSQPALAGLRHLRDQCRFQFTEVAAEITLLLVGQWLVAEHQHGVPIHARLDGRDLVGGQRAADVDAG